METHSTALCFGYATGADALPQLSKMALGNEAQLFLASKCTD